MFVFPKTYDVTVVGGGHAGVEAALAAARMGCETLLLTINPDTIGQMSCNPAIGGMAKGHLAREIDALGGEMGIATDLTGIHFRLLNTRKGPAVRAPRAQCDKKAYQLRLKWICERQSNLDVRLGHTSDIVIKDGVAVGVETDLGVRYCSKTIILTTGTFLRGLMHIGNLKKSGGRSGESASHGLTERLREIGFEVGRLKTGTPPRLQRRSIDYSKTETQPGDEPPTFFSYWHEDLFHVEQYQSRYPSGSILSKIGTQVCCHLTHTTDKTARIIRANLHKSPMYSGIIEGIGPRYCPSIEDKIVRFADKDTHQVFLEPEGVETEEVYVNGFSTSLPFEVQHELVRTIVGCESAEIIRPAYAVEYDFVDPTQLLASLESKLCSNLFLAGQINGTSGYEEAAAQGLMAGINAVAKVRGREPLILGRDQAYIGVLIDDLVTKGTAEPYRMFTSRAEFRLILRHDNADRRLSRIGYDRGLLSERNYLKSAEKEAQVIAELDRLHKTRLNGACLEEILRRPEITYHDLPNLDRTLPGEVVTEVETCVKYSGYIQRQIDDINKSKSLESKEIPLAFDYRIVPNLRLEARQKLSKIRPSTVGQATRISGVSPSDVSMILVWLGRTEKERTQANPSGHTPVADSDLAAD